MTCDGFAGATPVQLVGGAAVVSPPAFNLDLEAGSPSGCIFSPAKLNFTASPSAAAPGFEAALSFSFATSGFGYPSRGFTFLLSATAGVCGSQE